MALLVERTRLRARGQLVAKQFLPSHWVIHFELALELVVPVGHSHVEGHLKTEVVAAVSANGEKLV